MVQSAGSSHFANPTLLTKHTIPQSSADIARNGYTSKGKGVLHISYTYSVSIEHFFKRVLVLP